MKSKDLTPVSKFNFRKFFLFVINAQRKLFRILIFKAYFWTILSEMDKFLSTFIRPSFTVLQN